MQDIDLFLKVLHGAENEIDYDYHPQDGIGVMANPPRRDVDAKREICSLDLPTRYRGKARPSGLVWL
jgi:hypothetical protein